MTSIRNKKNVLLRKDVHGRLDIDLAKDHGQLGLEANLRVLANSTIHVQNMARIVVTRTPGWMDRHPNADILKANFIYLVETHAENWSGFEINSTISSGERASMDGQVSKAPTTRTVNPITPVANFTAIGEGVDINFWNAYMDIAVISSRRGAPDYGELVDVPETWTLEDYTWDGAVWEPNSTFTRARWAMSVAGMYPSTPVPINLERNVKDQRKIREYSITMEGAIYDDSQGVIDACSALEQAIGINRIKNSTKVSFFTDHTTQLDVGVEEGILKQIRDYGKVDA